MNRFLRACLALTLLVPLPVPASSLAHDHLKCPNCNLVFLNLDFLRADYVGLTGGGSDTPIIDHYFADAIVFENAYATAGSTYRGNLSVFTATPPHYFAIDVLSYERLRQSNGIGPWETIFRHPGTIAETLAANGYDTVALNKGRRSGAATLLDRGFKVYHEYPLQTLFEDLVTDFNDALSVVTEKTFLHLHAIPTRLHKAYYPVSRDRLESPDIIYKPYDLNRNPNVLTVISDYKSSQEGRRDAEHAIYRQQLRYADEQLQRVFKALEPLLSNTIVVLFSTHGTQIGDKGVFASDGVSYQSNIRVPLLIRHPSVHASKRVPTPISLIDLVPTLYDMLGIDIETPHAWSLLPVINGQPYTRPYLVGKNDHDEFVISGSIKLIARTRRDKHLYKLSTATSDKTNLYRLERDIATRLEYRDPLRIGGDRLESDGSYQLRITERTRFLLYDIENDPDETRDLSTQKPEIVERLRRVLEAESTRARDAMTHAISQSNE